MYVVADKMMPAEEPEQSDHKIVFEIDYSHFISFHGWIQLLQLLFGTIAIACCLPAPFATQIYFAIVVCSGMIGSFSLCLAHLRFPAFNKKANKGSLSLLRRWHFSTLLLLLPSLLTSVASRQTNTRIDTRRKLLLVYLPSLSDFANLVIINVTYFIIIYLM